MPRTQTASPYETVADILAKIGAVAPQRIRVKPEPGTATEKDLLKLLTRTDRLFELVDGVLVEKVMGIAESMVASKLNRLIGIFAEEHDLGEVLCADGAVRLMPGLVRIPDVSFISWSQLPGKVAPEEPIPGLAPELAIEVLSKGNTRSEMDRKLKDYFLSGVRLVWYVNPKTRTTTVYTAPDRSRVVHEEETLDGGDLLPGLTIPLRQVFARVSKTKSKTRRRKPGDRR
jgi:Uma2 family endonuclease